MVAELGVSGLALPGLTPEAQVSITRIIDAKLDLRLDTGENNIKSLMQKLDDSVDVRLTYAVGQLQHDLTTLSAQLQQVTRLDQTQQGLRAWMRR